MVFESICHREFIYLTLKSLKVSGSRLTIVDVESSNSNPSVITSNDTGGTPVLILMLSV